MSKKINYYSTDKLYKLKKNYKANKLKRLIIRLIIIVLIEISSFTCFALSLENKKTEQNIKYSENGNLDYKIYLKDNNYYESNYLNSGSNYKSNLIKIINIDFVYQINSEKSLNYNYKYKINSNLKILDKNNNKKVLYEKPETLLKETPITIENTNYILNKDIDIDYISYKKYLDAYKEKYNTNIDAILEVVMDIETIAKDNSKTTVLNKKNQEKIIIPLKYSDEEISIELNKINTSGLLESNKNISIKDDNLYKMSIILGIITIMSILYEITEFISYNKSNIYNDTVNNILNKYDKYIVNGKIDINENNYKNIIYPDNFKELLDASKITKTPILYYEVIPNEKCFFIICTNNTLYKYRLTRAYLEKEEFDKKDKN